MDDDSSTKFIESLTKFLQSLCNGYVEFNRGVELVGHIYLNIDTGEKVDYVLHEKVSKNDENSVTFVSNSFHALPKDKDTNKTLASANTYRTSNPNASSDDDDDDILIVDQPESVPGSTNSGTIPSRGVKRAASASSDQRRASALLHRSQSGGSMRQLSPWRNRQQPGPSASASSQGMSQENLSIAEVKLEQLSSDELLSLASQVGEGSSSSQMQNRAGVVGRPDHRSYPSNDVQGQQWIKQEPTDESQGLDTGWPQSDSSNSGSNLYPVMLHQNSAAFTSSPGMPGFSSTSGSASSRHGLGHHSFPGTSGSSNPYANPMPGTSQNAGGMDPSVCWQRREISEQKNTSDCVKNRTEYQRLYMRRYRQSLKLNPVRLQHYKERHRMHNKKHLEKKKHQRMNGCEMRYWDDGSFAQESIELEGGEFFDNGS